MCLKKIVGFYMALSMGTKAIIYTGSLATACLVDFIKYYKKVTLPRYGPRALRRIGLNKPK